MPVLIARLSNCLVAARVSYQGYISFVALGDVGEEEGLLSEGPFCRVCSRRHEFQPCHCTWGWRQRVCDRYVARMYHHASAVPRSFGCKKFS